MTRPKSWGEANQRKLIHRVLKWDGEATVQTVDIPLASKPVSIAVDNQSGKELTLTFAHLVRIDDTQASAKVGTGDDSFYTVTVDKPGKTGNEYMIQHVLPEDPEEATDIEVELKGKLITVTLAVKADNGDFIPDDDKNTAILIAAEVDKLDGFTATHDGDGSGIFSDATDDPIFFSGGTTPRWASLYDSQGLELSISITDNIRRVYGPFHYFPRFLGGRLTLTATGTPDAEAATIIQVVEG